MTRAISHSTVSWQTGTGTAAGDLNLIAEEPLAIRVQGIPYGVIMRTPGDEIAHAAGFCLGEGLVDDPDDIAAVGGCDGTEANVVTVTLRESRREKVAPLLDRRGFVSQTSCGICGREVIDDILRFVSPLTDQVRIRPQDALACADRLSGFQPLRRRTRASHAAALFDGDLAVISAAEDVGRHNALDKAVGKAFLDRRLPDVRLLVLSSRISYELVQKAARARIPVVLAVSRPTSLAVEVAEALRLTLACLAKDSDLYVFTCPERLA
ncbi:MAG: formate dehydrogenase accessory sulfurtransferase FdhD [Desulfobacterales bacterium]|jgi:FdhD protein